MTGLTERPVPVSPERLAALLTEVCAAAAGVGRVRVAVDGAAAAEPGTLADALVAPLRTLGLSAVRVHADAFLRPASVRWELGRTDPDAFYERWLDAGGLTREVLDPWGPAGTGRYLPSLWDAEADRATRSRYEPVPDRGVLLVDGTLLLGQDLGFDLTVHAHLSPAALRRRTPPGSAWTLPAFERYDQEVDPAGLADVVVRSDDPRHPAVIVRSSGAA